MKIYHGKLHGKSLLEKFSLEELEVMEEKFNTLKCVISVILAGTAFVSYCGMFVLSEFKNHRLWAFVFPCLTAASTFSGLALWHADFADLRGNPLTRLRNEKTASLPWKSEHNGSVMTAEIPSKKDLHWLWERLDKVCGRGTEYSVEPGDYYQMDNGNFCIVVTAPNAVRYIREALDSHRNIKAVSGPRLGVN